MPTYQIVAAIGVTLLLAGGIPAAIGTTNTNLFLLYAAVMLVGAGLLAYSKKLKDRG